MTLGHDVTITVRLVGRHDATADIAGDQVRVTMPGAVVTVDRTAAYSMWAAWCEAAPTARKAFTGQPGPDYPGHGQRATAAIRLTGPQPGPQILGKAANASPSGSGQVTVRLGGLTIVCDDRDAWDNQLAAWCLAYTLARQQSPDLPTAQRVADTAERRASERAAWRKLHRTRKG